MRTSCVKIDNRLYRMPRRAATALYNAVSGLDASTVHNDSKNPFVALRSEYSDFKRMGEEQWQVSKNIYDQRDLNVFISHPKNISTWISKNSTTVDLKWFLGTMEPIMMGMHLWCKPSNYSAMNTPEVYFLSKVVSEHPRAREVFELMAHINNSVNGSTGVAIDVLSFMVSNMRTDVESMPTLDQWNMALFGDQEINEHILNMPPSIVVPILSSL